MRGLLFQQEVAFLEFFVLGGSIQCSNESRESPINCRVLWGTLCCDWLCRMRQLQGQEVNGMKFKYRLMLLFRWYLELASCCGGGTGNWPRARYPLAADSTRRERWGSPTLMVRYRVSNNPCQESHYKINEVFGQEIYKWIHESPNRAIRIVKFSPVSGLFLWWNKSWNRNKTDHRPCPPPWSGPPHTS